MLEVAAAREVVLSACQPLGATPTPLAGASGRVLAEDVRADHDSPPFTKSLMDGYAVRAADGLNLRLTGVVAAGDPPGARVGPREAVRIFTGAPLPDGADAVVMVEKTEPVEPGIGEQVRLTEPVKPGQNVLPRGREMLAGDVVLPAGTATSPAAVGLLASVGRSVVPTVRPPRVAVMATGSELVEADATPGPGQIRNSNGPMLVAQAARAGSVPRYLGIGRDDVDALAAMVRDGLATADVLILAGGVSVGAFDLVPGVLRDLGVESHFHKVRMKPGKPLLFGTKGDRLVFGLPGNPVSSFVCFELFVRPALRALSGHRDPGPMTTTLPLSEPLTAKNDRPTFHPAKLEGTAVRPLPWFGSADLRALLTADALLALPPGEVRLDAGQPISAVVL
ncbi:MAG TPA: gephyrin-like molybdotransferase Glp [Fimbriiglobus sp.]|jgi:molybdopterin molybdotransferase|nr:gephyrin-like molybdotransferase Glp [Fimbriiglobus sp.]